MGFAPERWVSHLKASGAPTPGSSFWAEKKCRTSIRQSFPPDSEKNAGDRRPEKTSGSKILKNRDDKRLDHTQQTAFAPRVVFSWNTLIPQPSTGAFPFPLPSPIFRMADKSRTIAKYKQTCAQAKNSNKKPRSMWQGAPISLQPCL